MEKYDLMKKHINKWLESGLSIRQYCRDKNLPYEGFRHWRDKLAPESKRKRSSRNSKIVPVQIKEENDYSSNLDINLSFQNQNEIVLRIRRNS